MEPNEHQNAPATTITPHEPAKKTNSYPLAIIIACAILAVGGTAFGIYGTISSSNKSSKISDLETQLNQKEETPIIPEGAEEDIIISDNMTPNAPNPYTTFANNLSQNYRGTIFGHYYHYTGTENVQRTVTANVDNGHLKITDLDNAGHIIAVADNIISVYYITVGNGGTPYFYMIHKDGKVSRISIGDTSDRVIENLDDYNNIVSIVQGGDLYAWLIDIDGNVYKST